MLDVQVPAIRRTIMITDEELRNTQHESLVLWTVHDPTAPTTVADKMADLLSNSKKVILDGAGHWPQWEIPELFNQVHIDFLHGKDIVL